jgi:hypothetical protein
MMLEQLDIHIYKKWIYPGIADLSL